MGFLDDDCGFFKEAPQMDDIELFVSDEFICGLFLKDTDSGTIHRFGDDQHDSLWTDSNGVVHYHNLQNGDGCPLDGTAPLSKADYGYLPVRFEDLSRKEIEHLYKQLHGDSEEEK